MWFLIIYDIREPERLTKVAKIMEDYGQRVQKSVFEAKLERPALKRLQHRLVKVMDTEEDSVKFFRLCSQCWEKVEVYGQCSRMLPLKELEII